MYIYMYMYMYSMCIYVNNSWDTIGWYQEIFLDDTLGTWNQQRVQPAIWILWEMRSTKLTTKILMILWWLQFEGHEIFPYLQVDTSFQRHVPARSRGLFLQYPKMNTKVERWQGKDRSSLTSTTCKRMCIKENIHYSRYFMFLLLSNGYLPRDAYLIVISYCIYTTYIYI